MALDRLVTLTIDTGGSRVGGQYTPNNVSVTAWAERRDLGIARQVELAGARGDYDPLYLIRFDQRIVDAVRAGRAVTIQEHGEAANTITNVSEWPRGSRGRYLEVLA